MLILGFVSCKETPQAASPQQVNPLKSTPNSVSSNPDKNDILTNIELHEDDKKLRIENNVKRTAAMNKIRKFMVENMDDEMLLNAMTIAVDSMQKRNEFNVVMLYEIEQNLIKIRGQLREILADTIPPKPQAILPDTTKAELK